MGVDGLIGLPGAGKTYELTRRVLEAGDRDRLVFTNYAVSHPNVYMFAPDQLMDLPPGLVAIDEAHLWFPARMALKLPSSWLAGMSQTRKSGWDLIWSAQHEARIDSVVRHITSWMHLSNAWFDWNDHPVMFTYRTWEPEFFRREKKVMGRGMHFFDRRVANAYDTHERLVGASHTVDPNDPYARAAATRSGSVLEGALRQQGPARRPVRGTR